jgi:hypothetical protein
MKQTILVLTTMALFAACGGGADTSALGKKRAERDSLKTVYAELGVKIKDLETWLVENEQHTAQLVHRDHCTGGRGPLRALCGCAWKREGPISPPPSSPKVGGCGAFW